jgi:hypothetical protein
LAGTGTEESHDGRIGGAGLIRRVLKLAMLLFALTAAGMVAVAWFHEKQSALPLQYDGFD